MPILDNKDRIGSLLLLAFSVAYLRYALVLPIDPTAGDLSFTSRTLPVGLSVSAILLCLVQIVLSAGKGGGERISDSVRDYRWMPVALLVLLMSAYALLFDVLGFIVASFIFLLLGFLILGERRILLSTSVAAALVLTLWLMLTQAFGLYLDSGDLFRSLAGPAP